MIARRSFLTGLASLIAAPAIVHAGNLMPVKALTDYAFVGEQAMIEVLWGMSGCSIGDVLTIQGIDQQFIVTSVFAGGGIDIRAIAHGG